MHTDVFFYDKDGTFTAITDEQQNAVICRMLDIMRQGKKVVILSNNTIKTEDQVKDDVTKIIKDVVKRTNHPISEEALGALLGLHFSVVTTAGVTSKFLKKAHYDHIFTLDSFVFGSPSPIKQTLKASEDYQTITDDIDSFSQTLKHKGSNKCCIVIGQQVNFSLQQAKKIAELLNNLFSQNKPIPDIIIEGADHSVSIALEDGTYSIGTATYTIPAIIEKFINPEYRDKYKSQFIQTGKPYSIDSYKGNDVFDIFKDKIEHAFGQELKPSYQQITAHMIGDYPETDGLTSIMLKELFERVVFHHVASGVVTTEQAQEAVSRLGIDKIASEVCYHTHAGEQALINETSVMPDPDVENFIQKLTTSTNPVEPTYSNTQKDDVILSFKNTNGQWTAQVKSIVGTQLKELALAPQEVSGHSYYGPIANQLASDYNIREITIIDPNSAFDTTFTAMVSTLLNHVAANTKLNIIAGSIQACDAIQTAVLSPLSQQVQESVITHKDPQPMQSPNVASLLGNIIKAISDTKDWACYPTGKNLASVAAREDLAFVAAQNALRAFGHNALRLAT